MVRPRDCLPQYMVRTRVYLVVHAADGVVAPSGQDARDARRTLRHAMLTIRMNNVNIVVRTVPGRRGGCQDAWRGQRWRVGDTTGRQVAYSHVHLIQPGVALWYTLGGVASRRRRHSAAPCWHGSERDARPTSHRRRRCVSVVLRYNGVLASQCDGPRNVGVHEERSGSPWSHRKHQPRRLTASPPVGQPHP